MSVQTAAQIKMSKSLTEKTLVVSKQGEDDGYGTFPSESSVNR